MSQIPELYKDLTQLKKDYNNTLPPDQWEPSRKHQQTVTKIKTLEKAGNLVHNFYYKIFVPKYINSTEKPIKGVRDIFFTLDTSITSAIERKMHQNLQIALIPQKSSNENTPAIIQVMIKGLEDKL